MSFFQKLASYLLNEVLVNTLANSRTFQRFAIRSSGMAEELAKKTAEQKDQLANHSTEFLKVFREEMGKGLHDIQKGGSPGSKPK